jgi:hypothetical protein
LPVIKEFNVSNNQVSRGGEFTLSWKVENVNKLELYKNGAMFRTLDVNQRSVTLVGFADGTQQQSSYQLYAYKDMSLAKSDPIIITLKEKNVKKRNPAIIIGGVLVSIIIIGAILMLNIFPKKDKNPPTVNAGSDQSIILPTRSVLLSGNGNSIGGSISSYTWTMISGPASCTFTNNNAASTIADNLVNGTYKFQLMVTDNNGAIASDTTQVFVYAATSANAGSDQSIILPTTSILLSGNGTSPGGSISSYNWTMISGPAFCSFTNNNAASTMVNDLIKGTYKFQLMVTDNNGVTASDTTLVNVYVAPTANAGNDQKISRNSTTLTGMGTDEKGETNVGYAWTINPGAPNVPVIQNSNGKVTTVTGLIVGTYVFNLSVTDRLGNKAIDEVRITVVPSGENKKNPLLDAINQDLLKEKFKKVPN